ncbi:MAG: cupin domain-containing protein [Candidatus Binataceae bacterium]
MNQDDRTGERARGPFVVFTLEEARHHVTSEPQWQKNDRASMSIVKNEDLTVTMVMLKTGAHLKEHTTRKAASVHVLSGRIRFSSGSTTRELGAGMLAMVEGAVPHAVEAIEESALLVTAALG